MAKQPTRRRTAGGSAGAKTNTRAARAAHSNNSDRLKRGLRKFAVFFLLPTLIYSAFFFVANPSHLGQFNKSFYLDSGDGFQNVWNIWWVNESITELNQQPYFTDYVKYPHGVSLASQTMNIFNGLLGIVLINVFSASLVQAVNIAVLMGFIGTGITTFWLLLKLFRRYELAIIGGGLFAFSSYHFAHGLGHLQLISLQFLPLFILAFIVFTERLRWKEALYAGGALALVGLCDYYYLFYCLIFAGSLTLFKLYTKEIQINWRTIKLYALMGASSLVVLGGPLYLLHNFTNSGKILGSHDARMFSMDLLSPIIPGGQWRWAELTDWFWTRLPGYHAETSVFFGIGLLTLLAIFIARRKQLNPPRWIWFWVGIFGLFGILSLGPRLRIYGFSIDGFPLPYALLERLVPTFKISGMPVRMIVMTLLAGIIIGMFVLSKLNFSSRKARILLVAFVAVSILDVFPKSLPLTPSDTPEYIAKLQTLPPGAIIDNGAPSAPHALFGQTIHERKMAFGYTTRTLEEVENKDFLIFAALEEGRYGELCDVHGIRYLITRTNYPGLTYPMLYSHPKSSNNNVSDIKIFDLKNGDGC